MVRTLSIVALLVLLCRCQGGNQTGNSSAPSLPIIADGRPVDADVIFGGITYLGRAEANRTPGILVGENGQAQRIEIIPGLPYKVLGSLSDLEWSGDKKSITLPFENQIYSSQTENNIEAYCKTKETIPRELFINKTQAGYEILSLDAGGLHPFPEAGLVFQKTVSGSTITYQGGIVATLTIRKQVSSAQNPSYFSSSVTLAGIAGPEWNSTTIDCHLNLSQSIEVTIVSNMAQKTFKGPNHAAITKSQAVAGTVGVWSNPEYAVYKDGGSATVSGLGTSEYLTLTDFYGMEAIPRQATIHGILVKIRGRKDGMGGGGQALERNIRLVRGGILSSINKATGRSLTTSFEEYSFGGETDLWNESWTPEDLNSDGFGIAINYEFFNNQTFALIDEISITAYYTPPASKSLTMASANRATTWNIGSTKTLSWSSTGNIPKVNLLYSPDSGSSYPVVIANGIANTGSFNWLVNQPPTGGARIRVEDASDGLVADMNRADITIPIPSLTITSPNGGNGFLIGSNTPVTWNSLNLGGSLDILLSVDGGFSYTMVLATGVPNDGMEEISLLNTTTQRAKIKIVSSALQSLYDESDFIFAITPAPNLNTGVLNAVTLTTESGSLWVDAPFARLYDGLYAMLGGYNQPSRYLFAYGFFSNSDIPSNAILTGIKLEISAFSQGECQAVEDSVRIVKNGMIGPINKAKGAVLPSADNGTYSSYGGENDLWGETWSLEDLRSANTGFAFSLRKGLPCAAYVNHMRGIVYFSAP